MIGTFYSFKGGVGRSFSLVETAVRLASKGRQVLVWDLDLEAPGVQQLPALEQALGEVEIGTLDLVEAFLDSGSRQVPEDLLRRAPLRFELPDSLSTRRGRLDFLLPGVLDDDYARRFSEIDWAGLFAAREDAEDPQGLLGSAFFVRLGQLLERDMGYEIVLVDSRTGLTDLGAISTLVLPDVVVLVFNLNEQNLHGTERVYRQITSSRHTSRQRIRVFKLANMIPTLGKRDALERRLLAEKKRWLDAHGMEPTLRVPLEPKLFLTDALPSLSGGGDAWAPLAEWLERRRRELTEHEAEAADERRGRFGHLTGGDLDFLARRREPTFEEEVAELFTLSGFEVEMAGERGADSGFDLRLEQPGPLSLHVLVACIASKAPLTVERVEAFVAALREEQQARRLAYRGVIVVRRGATEAARAAASAAFVEIQTFDTLLRSLVDLDAAAEHALGEFQGTALERLYVEQEVVLESDLKPGKKPVAHGLTSWVEEWLDQEDGRFLALLGDFGSGKTSFCRRLASQLAEQHREDPDARAPVLLDLRQGASTTVTLESLLQHHFGEISKRPFQPAALLKLNREGHLVLFFDGFDETIAYTEASRFVENLRQILRAAEGRAKVILTCRTHYFRDQPEEVRTLAEVPEDAPESGGTALLGELLERSGVEIAYVREFDQTRIDAYLQKAVPEGEDWREARRRIDAIYNLPDLARRPFLLQMIVPSLPELAAGEGEVTLAGLYERYCAGWFRHTDFRLRLTADVKERLVEYLARLVWNSPEQQVHYEVLADKALEFFDRQDYSPFEKEKIDYEIRTAFFLHRDARGYYRFIHRSFLEFFLARTLAGGIEDGEAECLDIKPLTREVSFFLEQWDAAEKIPQFAGTILGRPYRPRVSENALRLLSFHARAKLGPLLGPGAEEAEERLSEMPAIFCELCPDAILLETADLSGTDLRGVDLAGARLRGARLAGAELSDAVVSAAGLVGADLSFADLRRTNLDRSVLVEADLNHADLRGAEFRDADLRRAHLDFALCANADFSGAKLEGSTTLGSAFLGARSARSAVSRLSLEAQDGHGLGATDAAWHPHRLLLATAGFDGTIGLWDLASGRCLRRFEGHGAAVWSVAWDPSGDRLASASFDQTVKLWDASIQAPLGDLEGHTAWVLAVAWDPSGERLASASYDRTVKLWDAATLAPLGSLEGHGNVVRAVAWDPSGNRLASASYDQTVKLWDASTQTLLGSLEGHTKGVYAVAWSPSGDRLASASYDQTVKLWDASSGAVLGSLEGHRNGVRAVAWSPCGERLASAPDDQTVKLWDASTLAPLGSFEGHRSGILAVAWSPSGDRLASASYDRTVKLWDASTQAPLGSLEGHGNGVFAVAWSPSGDRLASASDDQTVKLWDASTLTLLGSLEGHIKGVRAVAWSPSGDHLASASDDQTVKLWDASSGAVLGSLEGHTNGVRAVAWSPSGDRLASASDDQTVKLWDASSGAVLGSLEQHGAGVVDLAWRPDGDLLATSSFDGRLRIFTVEGRLLSEAWIGLALKISWHGDRIAVAHPEGRISLWRVDEAGLEHQIDVYPYADAERLLATPDGYVDGDQKSLERIHWVDENLGIYDLEDVPERHDPERVRRALRA